MSPLKATVTTVFDPAAFLADLDAAGCEVFLMQPVSLGRENVSTTYFIAPTPGYVAAMARWADAMDACPDHVERVVALLVERWEAQTATSDPVEDLP